MNDTGFLVLVVLALTAIGYVLGRSRALSSAGGDARRLHSLPSYYGSNVALFTAIPALLILAVWMLAQPMLIDSRVSQMIPDSAIS